MQLGVGVAVHHNSWGASVVASTSRYWVGKMLVGTGLVPVATGCVLNLTLTAVGRGVGLGPGYIAAKGGGRCEIGNKEYSCLNASAQAYYGRCCADDTTSTECISPTPASTAAVAER